jgi:hypothetical protein
VDWEDFKESLGNIKTNYREFLFGTIIGLVFGILISIFLIGFEIFLILTNLLLTAMILISLNKIKLPSILPTHNPNKETRKVCPECHSPARHKKNCSKAKK